MHQVALERGLILADFQKNKKAIRDHIRCLKDGEEEWIKLQSVIYGSNIEKAQIIEGAQSFFHLCWQRGVKTYIISHKTQFAKYDQTKIDLRLAALHWMSNRSFFKTSGSGLSLQDVFFEETRQGKINMIRRLECTHFIDDLEEVFLDVTFPEDVQKILYNPLPQDPPTSDIIIARSWAEITECIFP